MIINVFTEHAWLVFCSLFHCHGGHCATLPSYLIIIMLVMTLMKNYVSLLLVESLC